MSVDIGIIGLPQSGKTTIFNALTGGKAATSGAAPHVGRAKVPEPRLKALADMFQPRKVTPAEVRYIDIGAPAPGTAKSPMISGLLLNEIGPADCLLSVVRAFANASIPHTAGSLDVARDIANIDLELVLSDLAIIERRLERIHASLKAAKPQEHQSLLKEQELVGKIKAGLEKEIPIRSLGLPPEEIKALSHYQFLSAKPLLTVVNIGEEQLPQAAAREAELSSRYSRPHFRLIALCGQLEMELAQLDEADAAKFRTEIGLKESGLDRTIKASYELLGLISFFTVVSDELKVWPIPQGTTALKAAGKIHSDMERGFIRAEVTGYHDLLKCSGLPEARKKGLLRLEGKNYMVQDGDIITFLFHV